MSLLTGEIFGSSGDIKSPGSPSFAGIKLIAVEIVPQGDSFLVTRGALGGQQ
ncbi:unnamed protein product, partial [Cladocopium goreaui]